MQRSVDRFLIFQEIFVLYFHELQFSSSELIRSSGFGNSARSLEYLDAKAAIECSNLANNQMSNTRRRSCVLFSVVFLIFAMFWNPVNTVAVANERWQDLKDKIAEVLFGGQNQSDVTVAPQKRMRNFFG
ncbi:hypothetical protein EG68_03859 [Paragonimus skrjabini miyazakii]|uniref:Uncharacterized protein n=1 Tax=Paragonimus skrjabini miyazakii TaxID=59628 RepID=A0A8S9Z1I7_9TREM|nr:hypothetical protein EG68_03859 [Paragonimus skrjabini miyazakii]